MAPMNPLSTILEKNTLTGPNFTDWLRNLRIVLNSEKIGYILETPVPNPLPEGATEPQQTTFRKWEEDDMQTRCYMLASMNNELQRQHEKMGTAKDILIHLQELYGEQSRTARYEISKELFRTRLTEGADVSVHVLKMINMIERLENLDFSMDANIQTDLILQSLPDSFAQFIVNFHLNKIEVSLSELHNHLVTAQSTMKGNGKEAALMIASSSGESKKKKKKSIKFSHPKPTGGVSKKKGNFKVGAKCFHCQMEGHWKRNCPKYLESIKDKGKGKTNEGSTISCFLNPLCTVSSHSTSWVLDSGASYHVCASLQELTKSRVLGKDEVILKVGNGATVAATAIGSTSLALSSGHVLFLNNVLCLPNTFTNIISISVLTDVGYEFLFKGNICRIYYNNDCIGLAYKKNGLYHMSDDKDGTKFENLNVVTKFNLNQKHL